MWKNKGNPKENSLDGSVISGHIYEFSFHFVSLEAVLEARSVQVLVVSFGGVEGAQLWLEQTGCTFNIVLDPQRKVRMCVFTPVS